MEQQLLLKRKLEETILRFIQRREIIGIRGPRQSGKTTLLKIVENNISGTGNKAFVNLDHVEYRRALEENPLDFVRRFGNPEEEKKLYLFLDEVQKVKDAGEKLKIIYDEFGDRVKMFVSGSSSLELKTNVLPPLVGRMFLYELFTLDFEEFLLARDAGLHRLFKERQNFLRDFLDGKKTIKETEEEEEPAFGGEFLRYWKEYAVFGGYPEVVKSPDEETKKTVLKNIFNLYLENDIASFFKIEEAYEFENFLKALAFNVSGLLSLSSLASDCRLSHRRAEEFLAILRHTYLVLPLMPFHRNMTTELRKSPKVHFWDLGLRNAVIGNFMHFDNRTDAGPLMENFVARELAVNFAEKYKLNYWRTAGKAEVDFVLSESGGRGGNVIPVEVKMSGERHLGRSFYSFLDAYRPKRAVIVTFDNRFGILHAGETQVLQIPVWFV